jgi:hypothetical protein
MSTLVEQEFRAPAHIAKSGIVIAISPAPLVGTWTNLDSDPRDLVMVLIADRGNSITVETFGAGDYTPSNWGPVTGIAYAANLGGAPAVAFSAQYTFSNTHVILIGHLQGNRLLIETFTQFTDGSGRPNLYTADTLTR